MACVIADQPSERALYDISQFATEADRYATLESLGMLDTEPEAPFERITKIMSGLFKTPVSLITLVADPSRVWFKSCVGPFGSCVDRDGSWCNYVLVPTTPEVLITEDASKDARFAHNPYVAGEPFIKFYAGAPLIGARGERYGTLCVVDLVQRAFTAEMYSMLANFAALAVEEIERNKPLHQQLLDSKMNDIEHNRHLDLSLTAAREGVIMLDVRDSTWPIVYTNPSFEKSSGLASDSITGGHFWDLFERANKTKLELGLITGRGDTFEMRVTCKKTGKSLALRFMPATSDRLAPSKATGIPSWVPSEDAPPGSKLGLDVDKDKTVDVTERDRSSSPDSKCFWFAVVVESEYFSSATSAGGSSVSVNSTADTDWSADFSCGFGDYAIPEGMGNLSLGPLLGSGSFGKVYRGLMGGETQVAVKIMDCRRRPGAKTDHTKLDEVSVDLDHPHIVKNLSHGTSMESDLHGKIHATWIVQELCDMGTLTDASERGWLRVQRAITAPPDLGVIIPTLRDIADAMAYVHSKNIIHADLTGRNVLLTSSDSTPHGFIAKVCDFGISRIVPEGELVCTDTVGTITHMPPELLTEQLLLPAADVWSLGVLAWEAVYGKCCYRGKSFPQIVLTVARNKPLEWPKDLDENFVQLMKRCMSFKAADRPAFSDIVGLLDEQKPTC